MDNRDAIYTKALEGATRKMSAEERADIRAQLSALGMHDDQTVSERVRAYKEELDQRNAFDLAKSDIATGAFQLMHLYGKEIPSIFDSKTGVPEPDTVEILNDLVQKYMTMGLDFEKIINVVNDNPTLKSEWDRFCVFLRLAQE